MKIAIAQINPTIGDFSSNRKTLLGMAERASKSGADLLVFPELATCGYPPRDLLDSRQFIRQNLETLEALAAVCGKMLVVCGYVDRNEGEVGKPFHNAAAVLKDGKRFTVSKRLLPYYDIFEDERHFEAGTEASQISHQHLKIGITVCEDAWNEPGFVHSRYGQRPIEDFKDSKLDLLINIAASPFRIGKPALRHKLFENIVSTTECPAIYCNQVGGNDELIFDGCSFAMAESGNILAQGAAFEEDLVFVDYKKLLTDTSSSSHLPERSESAWLYDALILGLRDYVRKCGAKKVCLGLSGGIDSSVVAVLANEALGNDKVFALSLPTRFTANQSEKDAEKLASALGIHFKVCEIDALFEQYTQSLTKWFGKAPSRIVLENLQPRIRMTLLMAMANEQNLLLLNTSNKSEFATGYSTLYGDGAGALSVLGDLTKTQVYELAKYLNASSPIIPESVITRPPTAELWDNQTDQDKLPPYPILDQILTRSIEFADDPHEIEQKGIPKQAIDRFFQLYEKSEYKRRQAPPILRVSSKSFGMGRRIPIAKGLAYP